MVIRKSILDKWQNEIPPSTSLRWNVIWHKHKAQKETTILWLVIHKVVVVNRWCGRIQAEVDKSCPHCGLGAMESVHHRFFSSLWAQQVWCYAANIIWQLFAKRCNLSPWKSFSIIRCLIDQLLNKSLRPSSRNWFLRNGLMWIIWVNVMNGFSMLINGLWKRHTKWCGTPYLTLGE